MASFLITIIFPLVEAQTTVITSVSEIIPAKTQTITITGSGFGNQMPYTNQDSPSIRITDRTQGWNAGNTGNSITLDISSWSDSQIVITGFDGTYTPYKQGFALGYGDTVDVYVGDATYTTTVSMDKNTAPTFVFRVPTISGLTVSIGGQYYVPNKIDKSIIDWGDGSSSIDWQNGQEIQNSWIHTYSQGGTYVVKYTATDINGLSGSGTQTVNLQQQGQPIQTNSQPQSYSKSGTEYVKTDKTEYVVSETSSVQVNIYGMVGNPQGGYVNLTLIQPDGTAESLSGYVKGDGSFTLPLVLDTHSQTGAYQVKADYQGSSLGSTSFTVTAGVVSTQSSQQYQHMDITFNSNVNGLTVHPIGNIHDPNEPNGGDAASVLWNWGDGQTSSGANVFHTYSSAGTYTITLTATDSLGYTDTASEIIHLQGEVTQTTPQFAETKQCYDGTVIPITSICPTPPSTQQTSVKQVSGDSQNSSDGITGFLASPTGIFTIIGIIISVVVGIILFILANKKTEKNQKVIANKIEKIGEKLENVEDKVARDALGKVDSKIKEITEKSVDEVKDQVKKKFKEALDDL